MKLCADLCSAHNFTDQPISAMIHPHFSIPYCGQSAAFLGIVGAIQYRLPLLTTKLNGSSVTGNYFIKKNKIQIGKELSCKSSRLPFVAR